MKIGYDAKRLFHNHTGLGNYSRSIVSYHQKVFSDDQVYLFDSNPLSSRYFKQFESPSINLVKGKKQLFWRIKGIKKDIQRQKIDVYHGLSNELPFHLETIKGLAKVVTIHDLIFMKYPNYFPIIDRKIYKMKFNHAAKIADKVIAVSEATKKDIIRYFSIKSEKIEVVYQSCDEIFSKNNIEMAEIKIAKDRPIGVFVSSLTERKNLKNVILALNSIIGERPLICVVGDGKKHKKELIYLVKKLNLEHDVKFLGHLDNVSLKALYLKAHFTIYPSFYEGFGIPILESMFCGTPVITSNCSSMIEAASGFAHLIDPHSIVEIAEAMIMYSQTYRGLDDGVIEKMRQKFNPEQQVQKIRQTYHEI